MEYLDGILRRAAAKYEKKTGAITGELSDMQESEDDKKVPALRRWNRDTFCG